MKRAITQKIVRAGTALLLLSLAACTQTAIGNTESWSHYDSAVPTQVVAMGPTAGIF